MLDKVAPVVAGSHWLAEHVAAIPGQNARAIPVLTAADVRDILPGLQLWDCWTIDGPDGSPILFDGWRGWVIMCAPRNVHPDLRHDVARLRLALERDGDWVDCGYLLPEDRNPGSREWAGSTVFDATTGKLTLYFTATGRKGGTSRTFEQRLFQINGKMRFDGQKLVTADWGQATENVIADGRNYMIVDQHEGVPGFIKGFRDPFHFRDDATGDDYLLFTASAPNATSEFNGVIGIAHLTGGDDGHWELLPPLISAVGVNNELERPVMRKHQGLYYVFWSTQRKTFAPDGPSGPNGLYGMVADSLAGPYRPLNGTGLVAPNPPEEPYQCYSWWVDSDFRVTGFVDLWGLDGLDPADNPALVEKHFGGVPSPAFALEIERDRVQIVTL